jgi:phage-related protein
VDKNRNQSRQLFHTWGALLLALPLCFTVPMQAQTAAPDNTMPPTAAPPTQVPRDTAPPDTRPPDTAPNPPERAEPVGPDRQGPTTIPRDRDITERDIADMDHFLDHHPEIAEQLRRDPSLIDNQKFVANHPELQEYLQMHPSVRKEFDENPNAFMHAENRYDRRQEERGHYDNGVTREELASMDHFLDKHPEIAEQLRKDPSLIDNRRFVADHPALQEYLQSHPRVSAEFHEYPNVFMHDEERYDRREDNQRADTAGYYGHDHDRDHDRDFDRREVSSFGEFLRGHSTTADALSGNPSLANNREFLETHPDLREYLQAHPGMQRQLSTNPQGVMTSPALAGTTAPPQHNGVTAVPPQHKGVATAPPLKQPDQPIKPEPPIKPEMKQH